MAVFGFAPQRPPEAIERKRHLRAMRGLRAWLDLVEQGPSYDCPVCGYAGRFCPVRETPGLWCPACDSRPRHRLFKLWLDRKAALSPDMRVLHFAAEPALAALLRPQVADYRTADIAPGFDLQLDLTDLALPDACFDLVIANHVLEHVDDRAALAEIHRILAPGGRALLTVPLAAGWDATHEDPALSPDMRHAYYTDRLHLRMYGADFADRLAAHGFAVASYAATEPDVTRHGLLRGERLFIASKPS
ncbi:MAG: methyltransferase domain-containing protein [Pseudomonadota bacterium]